MKDPGDISFEQLQEMLKNSHESFKRHRNAYEARARERYKRAYNAYDFQSILDLPDLDTRKTWTLERQEHWNAHKGFLILIPGDSKEVGMCLECGGFMFDIQSPRGPEALRAKFVGCPSCKVGFEPERFLANNKKVQKT